MGWGTETIKEALAASYTLPQHICMFEVADRTGSARRYCDALVLSLWQSYGWKLQGFEIKISRTDWLKELRDPSKADLISQFCDQWWVVIGTDGIAKPEEIPPQWGLMLLDSKRKLKIQKKAKQLKRKDPSREFLAALVRRAAEQAPLKAALNAEFERGKASAEAPQRDPGDWARRQLADLAKKVSEFEEASGIHIKDDWRDGAEIGDAVQTLLRHRSNLDHHRSSLVHMQQQLTRMQKSIATGLKEFDEFLAKVDNPIKKAKAS